MSPLPASESEPGVATERAAFARLRTYGMAATWILAIGAVVYFGFQALRPVSVVVLAVVLAFFPAAVLWKPVRWLEDRNWPPMLATSVVLMGAALLLTAVGFLVFPPLASSFGEVSGDAAEAVEAFRRWLVTGPLSLSEAQVDSYWQSFMDQSRGTLRSGILGGASAAADVLTGLAILLITTFFILKDGDRAVRGILARIDPERSKKARRAIRVGWDALGTYMRGLAIVGVFDAVLIGLGLLILGVPLVLPLSLLVFFGAFFPVVGAWITGLLAVAVAFVNGSLTDALIVLAIITVVQQIEGDLVLPAVFGRTLEMHPLVILLAVVAGGVAFGVIGSFLFVPAVAVAITVHQELADDPDGSLVAVVRGVDAATEPVHPNDRDHIRESNG